MIAFKAKKKQYLSILGIMWNKYLFAIKNTLQHNLKKDVKKAKFYKEI